MNDATVYAPGIQKEHAIVHFFALLAGIDEVDVFARLLVSGISSFLPMDEVVLGFGDVVAGHFRVFSWQRGQDVEVETAPDWQSMEARLRRTLQQSGAPLHKTLQLVHLGEPIGQLAIARRGPAELSADEEFVLNSLQTLTSLLLGNHRGKQALRHSQEWLRVTLRSIGDAVMACDAEGRIRFLNPVAEKLTGWSTAEALDRPIQEVFRVINETNGAPANDVVAQVLREGHAVALENSTALLTKTGRQVPIEDSAAPITDANGNVSGVVLVFHDVTERRRAQEALRESEQRVRLKLESILSPDGDIGNLELADVVDAPALQRLMGEFYKITRMPIGIIDLKGKVLVGVGWQDICTKFHRVNPESCKHCIESDVELSADVAPGEFKLYRCKNHMWDVATPITVGGKHVGNLFSGQFFFQGEPLNYDLFRAQARQYGFDNEEYIAALERVGRLNQDTVKAGMAHLAQLADTISKLSYSNVQLARSLAERKRAEEEIARRNRILDGINTIFREALHCETDEELGQTCIRVAEEVTGSKFGFIGEIGADGLLHDLAISDIGWELCAMHDKTGHRRAPGNFKIRGLYGRVLKDGKSQLVNSPAEHPDSIGTPPGHPALTSFVGVPLVDSGRTVGIIALANREGGYGRQELESLESMAPAMVEALHRKRSERALIRNEKLASVGRLAATIAHEVNNPLAGATNALFLVAEDKSLSPHGRAMADIAERELRRAAQMTRRILGFYREPNTNTSVNVVELLNDLVALYAPRLKDRDIQIRLRCEHSDAAVVANSSEIRQIFSNLLANSIDAIGKTGTVHMRVSQVSANGTRSVRVTVADSGAGIEPHNVRRLFEPFFTTKKDVGSGLGLWICEQIVKRHGGKLRVRSRVGRGTVFSVQLPAANTPNLTLAVAAGSST